MLGRLEERNSAVEKREERKEKKKKEKKCIPLWIKLERFGQWVFEKILDYKGKFSCSSKLIILPQYIYEYIFIMCKYGYYVVHTIMYYIMWKCIRTL